MRTTVIRLYLSGLSQEEISIETGVSEGTVNAIMQEISDDNLILQREVAIVCKKAGITVKQLASNLAFENSIKRLGFEEGKIHAILKAISRPFTDDGIQDLDFVAKVISDIATLTVKNNVSLEELSVEIQNKYLELNRLKQEIKNAKWSLKELQKRKIKLLSENRLTHTELNRFRKTRKSFEKIGLDFKKPDEIENVLRNIKEKNCDIPDIINELKVTRSLENKKQDLQNACNDLQNVLAISTNKQEEQKRYWSHLYPAIDLLNKLLQRGIDQNVILIIFDVLQKHPYLSISAFSKDIDTYGGIEGAIFKKRKEYIDLTDRINSLKAQGNIEIDTIESTF
ncbi:MAG: hypothetical protein M3O68_04250 [Thermoproteota archaeon]|nr:hypothetical protein [Thermoproteota archaeon]